MCGRTKLTAAPEALLGLFGLFQLPEAPPRYNVAPTQPMAVIRVPGVLEHVRFGLLPGFAKSEGEGSRFINARAETVATLPAYREAFRKRRCLVVVDGFYEWKRDGQEKQPFLVRLGSSAPFALGGLWASWASPQTGEVIDTCAIITTPAEPPVSTLHDRMPLILAPASYAAWLAPGTDANDLLRPARLGELVLQPVSRAVNSPRNDGPECVEAPDLKGQQLSLLG